MEAFWARVNKLGPTLRPELGECWIWTGKAEADGYARISSSLYGDYLAHRAAWKFTYGDPGVLCVLHKCDNRKCCRPDHLFLGTRKDNGEDMAKKGRHADVRGSRHPGAKLDESDIRAIRQRCGEGEMQTEVAKAYNITNQAVYLIVKRKTWNHVQ